MNLLTNQAADGSSAVALLHGRANLYVVGTFGGGTLALEALAPDGVTYVPVNGVNLSAAGAFLIDRPPVAVRVTLSGATAADVSVWLEPETNPTYQSAALRAI